MDEVLKSKIEDIRSRESVFIVNELIGDKKIVLDVGCSWGMQYFGLSKYNKKVINIDIAEHEHLDNFVRCDITKGLPFENKSFDAVILGDVLEHLWGDYFVLKETRRILKDDGILVVTIPFFEDLEEFHVRIHSPKTIRRLLNATGFKIVRYVEREGLVHFYRLLNLIIHPIYHKTTHNLLRKFINTEKIAKKVFEFDLRLGNNQNPLLKRSRHYGAYISAVKGEKQEYRQLNIDAFKGYSKK